MRWKIVLIVGGMTGFRGHVSMVNRRIGQISRIMKVGVHTMNEELYVRNPIAIMMDMMSSGVEFEVVDIPKCECKWYVNENGEYVRDDGT